MILYNLKCTNGHNFNSWFASAETFDKLSRLGQLSCEVCGCSEKYVYNIRSQRGTPKEVFEQEAQSLNVKPVITETFKDNSGNTYNTYALENKPVEEDLVHVARAVHLVRADVVGRTSSRRSSARVSPSSMKSTIEVR